MIVIEPNSITIEFKKGPFSNSGQDCIYLVLSMLNLSEDFKQLKKSGKNHGKKMNKTNRIRLGIKKFVNKDGITPSIIDNLIVMIRNGLLEKVKVVSGKKTIDLTPNEDVYGVISSLMIQRMI